MHNTNYHGPVSTNWCMWKSKTNSATEEHCSISLHMARCFYPTFIWLMSYLYSASGWSLLFWLWGWQKWLWILFKFFCLGSETRGWTLSWFFGVLTIGLASVSCFGFRLSSYGNHIWIATFWQRSHPLHVDRFSGLIVLSMAACWQVQSRNSGKYASDKKVAQNTSDYCNFARNTLHFSNLALGASTLPRINVFWATFLPEAYLPDFDSCTKYTDFWKRWSTGGIVEAGSSILLDWNWTSSNVCLIQQSTQLWQVDSRQDRTEYCWLSELWLILVH